MGNTFFGVPLEDAAWYLERGLVVLGIVGALMTGFLVYINSEIKALEASRVAPRNLTDGQVVKIADALWPFAGVVFQLFTFRNADEPARLSQRIKSAVLSAGWVEHPDSVGWLTSVATGIVVIGNQEGTERDRAAAAALTAALLAHGIEARTAIAGGIRIGVGVKIQVAQKP